MVLKLIRPVDGRYGISSPFGWRKNPHKPSEDKFHNGIDFAVPAGTLVKAFASGICFKSGWESDRLIYPNDFHVRGLGLRVWQEFDYEDMRLYGWYGHLSQIYVDPGQVIKPGDVIGLSGNTGSSTGAHLHVQFRQRDTNQYFDAEWLEEITND